MTTTITTAIMFVGILLLQQYVSLSLLLLVINNSRYCYGHYIRSLQIRTSQKQQQSNIINRKMLHQYYHYNQDKESQQSLLFSMKRNNMHLSSIITFHRQKRVSCISMNNNNMIEYRKENNLNNNTDENMMLLYTNDNNDNFIESSSDDTIKSMDEQRRSIIRYSLQSASAISFISSMMGGTTTALAKTLQQQEDEYLIPNPIYSKDYYWPIGKIAFSLLPLAGTSSRRYTIEEIIIPNCIYTHDQIQGIVNVNVPVRQTVIVLKNGGGLWVHNPVAPTPQLLQMMNRLIVLHGPIRHIVLGTVALEHKATFGPFASYYPNATVWIQPNQWSYPITIPIEFLGVQQRGLRLREIPLIEYDPLTNTTTILSTTSSKKYNYYALKDPIPEWMNEIEYDILGPFEFQSVKGCYSESVFYHKDTQTLIVTDCVVSVTVDNIPAIVLEDPRALLYHSRDNANEMIMNDTLERRQKGWRRMIQFGLIFFPSQINVSNISKTLYDIKLVPNNLKNLGNDAIPIINTLYPWSWNDNDIDLINFNAIRQNGTLFVPPILTKLILDREPNKTLEFVNRITKRFYNMKRIIPCHLNNNIMINNVNEFYNAFEPLRSTPNNVIPQRPLVEDLALLQKASDILTKLHIIEPSQICDGEVARDVGRFASASTKK